MHCSVSIGIDSFQGCSSLTSIVIPDSVTSLGAGVFQQCTSLTSVTFGNRITALNQGTFLDCQSLVAVSIPSAVSHIGMDAFRNCTTLRAIVIPDSVQQLDNGIFFNCNNLASVRIPDSVTRIGNATFQACDNLVTIIIPNSVTHIGDGSFAFCRRLQNVTLSRALAHIGHASFRDCISLAAVDLPNSTLTLGMEVFSGCTQLSQVNLSSALESIPYATFRRCSSLTAINIPDGVAFLGSQSFSFCSRLASIELPDSVIVISESSFRNCTSLTSIAIPFSVISVGDFAFAFCNQLSSVHFSYGTRVIGEYSFMHCSSLTSVVVPSSVASVGDGAFQYCVNLHTVDVQSNTTLLGRDVFATCACPQSLYVAGESLCGCIFCADTTTVAPTVSPSAAPTHDPFVQLQNNLRCDPSVLEDRAPRFSLGGGGHSIDECRTACLGQGSASCSALVLTATGFCHMFTACSYMYDVTSTTLLWITAAPTFVPTRTPTTVPSDTPTASPTPATPPTNTPTTIPLSTTAVDHSNVLSASPTIGALFTLAPSSDTSLVNSNDNVDAQNSTLLLVVASVSCIVATCMVVAVVFSRRLGRLRQLQTIVKSSNHVRRVSGSLKDIMTNPMFADNKYYTIHYDSTDGASPSASEKQVYYSAFNGGEPRISDSTTGSHLYEYHLSVNEDVSIRGTTLYGQCDDVVSTPHEESKFYAVNASRKITMRESPDDEISLPGALDVHHYETPVPLPKDTDTHICRTIAWYDNSVPSNDVNRSRGRASMRSTSTTGMPSPSPVRITRGKVLNGNPGVVSASHAREAAQPYSACFGDVEQPQRVQKPKSSDVLPPVLTADRAPYAHLIQAVTSHPLSSGIDLSAPYDQFVDNTSTSAAPGPPAPYDQFIDNMETPIVMDPVPYNIFSGPLVSSGGGSNSDPYYSSVKDEPSSKAYAVIETTPDVGVESTCPSTTAQPDFYWHTGLVNAFGRSTGQQCSGSGDGVSDATAQSGATCNARGTLNSLNNSSVALL